MLWVIAILQSFLYGLNLGHSMFSTDVIYVFRLHGVHEAFERTKTEGVLKKWNDGFVHSPVSGHDVNSVFLSALTLSLPW